MPDEQPYQDPDQLQQPDQIQQPDQTYQSDQTHQLHETPQPHQIHQPEATQRPGRQNQSRQPDPVSIGSGFVFFLIGGAYLLASAGHLTVNAGWTLSLLALGLGLSGIVGAILRSRRSDDRHD